MPKKKLTNPIMTPEWLASIMETCVVPCDSFEDKAGHYDKAKEAFMEYHRKRQEEEVAIEQSTAAAPPVEWDSNPILTALSELMVRLYDGRYEDARQATQTINRLLALGGKVEPEQVRQMILEVWSV